MNKKKTTTPKTTQAKPWSGHTNEYERSRPGGLLMGALLACAAERGHSLNELCKQLGFVPSYLQQLRTGIRSVRSISDDFSRSCADYLVTSRVHVLFMAGQITPGDFFESNDAYSEDVLRAMNFICLDPEWGHLITNELRSSGIDSQYAVVRLYEAATETVLMRNRTDPTQIIASVNASGAIKHVQASILSM